MRRILRLTLLAATVCSLAGCGDVERTFGLTRDAPDEFTVETRAPLSMPPTYALRPPEPGAPRPQEITTQQAAEAALVPEAALSQPVNTTAMTPGQEALLHRAGPPAPPGIRATVDQETDLDRPRESLTDRLLFWRSRPPAGTVLDPVAESRRLREDAALGEPPTTGATPIIQDKPKSSFLGIF